MALFKISRGGYSNLPASLTDGWAYFTPDNKGFYIDVVDTVNDTTYNQRIKINDRVDTREYDLTASGWTSKTYTLSVPEGYDDGTYLIDIDVIPAGGIDEQFIVTSAAARANMKYEIDSEESKIFIVCNGTQPTVTIPIRVKFIPSELAYAELFSE